MDTPQVLLEHYLKQLHLPSVLREYPKLAEQCAKDYAAASVVPGVRFPAAAESENYW